MASSELEKLLERMRAAGSFEGDLMTMRKMMSRAPAYPKPDDITWEPLDAAGVPAEWVIPDDCAPGRVIVYFHGGGYATGTLESTLAPCAPTSLGQRAPACSRWTTDWRRSILSPRPSTTQSRRTASRSRPASYAEAIALGGDSSGGGLALATLVALRDLGDPMPVTAVCMSPWTDLTLSGASLQANGDADPMVQRCQPSPSWPMPTWARSIRDRRPRPHCSRIWRACRRLLVQVGTGELLRDDATRFAERADAAGVDVTLEMWDDVFHVWQAFADLLPEASGCHRADRCLRRQAAQCRPMTGTKMTPVEQTLPGRSAMNDLLSTARALRPVVEAEADATDRELTMTRPVVEALAESGLNHLQVPKELGGLEADVDTTLDVLEEVAHQDGSIGWTFMANANATAMCSMFDPSVAREMLEGRPEVVCAGQFVSRGKAKRVDGGFEVHGRFQFGSGIARATWIGGGALVLDADGNRELNEAGTPKVLAFVVPCDSVEITGNWDVMGLRGTGSFDYLIPEQVVEAGPRVLDVRCRAALRRGRVPPGR